jgi:SAM-dependent methyltransferase
VGAEAVTAPGEEYYLRNYRDYDRQNPEHKLRYYRNRIETYRNPALPNRIYDIGCGPGNFLRSFDRSWSIFGSDINAFAIENARRTMPHGQFVLGAGASAVLFAEPMPVITALDVLEHVPDLELAAARIREQLMPGGLLLFVVPVYDGLSGPIVWLLDRDPTHVHKRPRSHWLEWAGRHFEVIAWEGIVRYKLPGPLPYLNIATASFRAHTPAILVACRPQHAAAQ